MSRYVDVSPHAIDRYIGRIDPTASRRAAAVALADALRGARRLHGQGDNRAHYMAPDGSYRLVVAQDGQLRVIVTVLPPVDVDAPGDGEAEYEGVRVVPPAPPPPSLARHNAAQAAHIAAIREAMEGRYRRELERLETQVRHENGRACRAWALLLTCAPHVPPHLAAAITGTVPPGFEGTGALVDVEAGETLTGKD